MALRSSGMGVPSKPGATGAQGPQGLAGPKGDTGPQGPAGIQGVSGAKGDAGSQGVAGPTGATGPKGDTGSQGVTGPIGATGAQGAKGDTGLTGAQGVKGDTGATGLTGPAGSNASATPLGTTAPRALGTATPGTSANAAREDHVHPLPSGRWELIGTLTVTENLIIALSVGMKRMTLPLAGVAATDRLIAIPTGAPSTGCEVVNAYPAAAGSVSIGYYTPTLGALTSYSIPIAVYRIT
jgi:hypothetical protein